MDASYWHERWAKDELAFHQEDFNTLMVRYFSALGLSEGACVFVPLCGKTRDIAWLLGQGYRIVGAELSETAVRDLFDDLGETPSVTQDGALLRFSTPAVTVFVGDIFDLQAHALGHVNAVFDRAALVALPDEMRARYAAHVMAISERAPQFVLTYTYDQTQMDGPPFSVTPAHVTTYFSSHYDIQELGALEIPALKGKVPATETAWLLRP